MNILGRKKMTILSLSETACQNATLSGGKAVALSRLISRYPVPVGFCITAAASDDAIAKAYQELEGYFAIKNLAVAIRSSASDEDGMDASFAGQYKTYLNIAGETNVIDAVRQCFESRKSAGATAYKVVHKKNLSRPFFAVLVQKLIKAQVSAVVFSANPVTKNRDEIIINANWGLGESIVSGRVTPDSYIVSKSENTIKTRQKGEKHIMISPNANENGVVEQLTPHLMAASLAMTDEQIFATARLALKLENELGFPVDVECAWQGGKLYLLQCRPITTLANSSSGREF